MSGRQIALCGVLSALAAAVLALGGVIPAATFCAPVLAMAALLPVLEECGPRPAGTAWIAVSLLALILDPDREAALVYLFFGWYPLLRPQIARLPFGLLRLAARLAVCSAACFLLYGVVWHILGLPDGFGAIRGFWALMLALANTTFLIFDRALEQITLLWRRRLRRHFFRQL